MPGVLIRPFEDSDMYIGWLDRDWSKAAACYGMSRMDRSHKDVAEAREVALGLSDGTRLCSHFSSRLLQN